MSAPSCAIIIVTHNSHQYIHRAVECLLQQSMPHFHLIIVDSKSSDNHYLAQYLENPRITVKMLNENVGFCKGNNIGASLAPPSCQYILFLNPDAFLPPSFLEEAHSLMEQYPQCGAMTSLLLAYDISTDKPTGSYDSTGIFGTWYGKWYDRDQGKPYHMAHDSSPEIVPAICGALMFCRQQALDAVKKSEGEIFDERFYMYKEDIDLSWRLKQAGWQLFLFPSLIAYHCRGWRKRSKVPRHLRLLSARNELRFHLSLRAPIKSLYSSLKYAAVYCLNW